jgi:hypothetical protein
MNDAWPRRPAGWARLDRMPSAGEPGDDTRAAAPQARPPAPDHDRLAENGRRTDSGRRTESGRHRCTCQSRHGRLVRRVRWLGWSMVAGLAWIGWASFGAAPLEVAESVRWWTTELAAPRGPCCTSALPADLRLGSRDTRRG